MINNLYIKATPTTAAVTWGSITGTLSDQTDLQSALNAKQDTLTLTTTGTSGAATLVGATLNIPQYSGGGSSNPSVISLDITDGTVVTGTTTDTLSKSMLITANTFTTSGMLEVLTRALKTGSAGNVTIRIYLNTSNTITGATLIATLVNTNSQFFQSIRNMSIKSNTLSTILASTASLSDFSIAGNVSNITYNTNTSYYLLFSIQLANSTDSAVIKFARATKYI
jgi:hypothetical protein